MNEYLAIVEPGLASTHEILVIGAGAGLCGIPTTAKLVYGQVKKIIQAK